MLQKLLKNIKLHKHTPLVLLLCFGIFFLIGFGLILLILGTDPTTVSYGTLGAIIGAIGVVIFSVISFLSYHQDFMLALSMGRTRKEFMLLYALEQLIWVTVSYAGLILMAWLESKLYAVLFPNAYEEFSVLPILTKPWVCIASIAVLVIVPIFLGAMYSRFGKKFGLIVYFVWFGGCIGVPRMIEHFDQLDAATQQALGASFGWIQLISPLGWIVIGIAVAIAMCITVIHLGMKQMVR